MPSSGRSLADLLDALGDRAQGVDVEAGVGLVEDGQLGLEDGHLQDLVALLLAAGEALVEVAVGEGGVHAEALHPLHDGQAQLEHRQVDALAGRQRLAQELDDRDAGDLLRVLEGQEHAGLGPDLGRPVGDVVALVQDAPARDLVLGVGQQGVGEGRLARAVRAHHGVHLAGLHDQVDAPEDLSALGRVGRAGLGVPRCAGARSARSWGPVYFPYGRSGNLVGGGSGAPMA